MSILTNLYQNNWKLIFGKLKIFSYWIDTLYPAYQIWCLNRITEDNSFILQYDFSHILNQSLNQLLYILSLFYQFWNEIFLKKEIPLLYSPL